MVDTKISALGAVVTPTGTDEYAVNQAGTSKKITNDQIGTYYKTRNAVNNASVSTPGSSFSSDTYLVGSSCAVPTTSGLGSLQAKSQYRLKFSVVKTAAGLATPVVNIRFGTLGTTSDANLNAITFAAQTAAIDEGLFEIFTTFRTVGSGTSAVVQSVGTLVHRLSATGLSTDVSGVKFATSAGFNSTTAGSIIGASVNAGASAAWTIALVQAELFNLA